MDHTVLVSNIFLLFHKMSMKQNTLIIMNLLLVIKCRAELSLNQMDHSYQTTETNKYNTFLIKIETQSL